MLAGRGHQQGSEVVRRCGKQGAQEGEEEGDRTGGKAGSHTQLMGSRGSGKSVCVQGPVFPRCVMETHYTRVCTCLCAHAGYLHVWVHNPAGERGTQP